MALSWIFSGKKKEDKPIPVTVEAVEVGSYEDYALIQGNSSPSASTGVGIYPQIPPAPYPYTPLPYSVLPQPQRQNQHNVTRTNSIQNQLEGVPFILAPAIENSSNPGHQQGIEDLRRAVFQIAADINDSMYDYDFKLEKSVLQEASMYNNK